MGLLSAIKRLVWKKRELGEAVREPKSLGFIDHPHDFYTVDRRCARCGKEAILVMLNPYPCWTEVVYQ